MLLFIFILTLLNPHNWKLSGRLPWLFRICLPNSTHLWRYFHISGFCSDKNCLPVRILLIYGNQKIICMTTFYHMWRENGCSWVKIFFFFCHFCYIQYSTMINNFCLLMTCFQDYFSLWLLLPVILNDTRYFEAQHKLFMISVRNPCHCS